MTTPDLLAGFPTAKEMPLPLAAPLGAPVIRWRARADLSKA
ncbi:MAG: hypothetical protein ACRET2_15105 [Steroidobacteraceae bacterium]